MLKSLTSLTGDNLDQYVKASQLTAQNRNKDLHLFTSNIIFPCVASVDICNDPPKVDIGNLSAENVLLSPDSAKREKLKYSYCVLLARILCTIPAFQRLRKLLPDHIPHEYTRKMSAASKVYPLPIMFKNKAKHSDCLAIMDGYESQLVDLYTKAFGKYNDKNYN